MNPIAALLFFITIVNLFLGTLVFFRNRSNPLHLSLSGFIFLVAAWMFSMGAFYQVTNISDAFWWIRWTYVFGIVLAHTLVYFSLIFPSGSTVPLRQILLVYTLALPMIAALLFMPNFLFKEIVAYSWWKDVRLGVLDYTIYTIYFIVVYFGAIAILFKKYFAYSGKLKLQVTYVLCAVFIAGSFGAIFDLLYPWLNLYKYIWLGPIGTLIMVGIFIYAIVKHRFLDIRLIVARTVAYSLLITVISIFYVAATFLVGSLFLGFTTQTNQLFIYMSLSVVVALSFEKLRIFFEKITDKIFFKGHYDSNQLLSDLGHIMSSTIELQSLVTQTLRTMAESMKITKWAMVLHGENANYEIISEGFIHKLDTISCQFVRLLNMHGVIVFDDLEEGELKQAMRNFEISIAKVLHVEEKIVGFLILGEKASGDLYSGQDLKVLDILAPEMSVAIQNSESYEKIKWFNVILSGEVSKATKDLKSANLRLQELDKLKNDFVSVASHELRTPMTAIRSYVWMALNRPDVILTEKMKKYLSRTLISTERLINLVNDMLNVSRIEAGSIEIKPQSFDIRALVKDVVTEIEPKADEKLLNLEIEKGDPLLVFADPDKVHQVLLNLIGNSLKFTPVDGRIKINFFPDGKMVEVSVCDNGVGISKDDLGRLFRKFGRLDNSYVAAATSGGTGLGLFISKSLIEFMYGKIWASSEGQGKGAIFTFSLPAAVPEVLANADSYAKKSIGEAKGLEPVRI